MTTKEVHDIELLIENDKFIRILLRNISERYLTSSKDGSQRKTSGCPQVITIHIVYRSTNRLTTPVEQNRDPSLFEALLFFRSSPQC